MGDTLDIEKTTIKNIICDKEEILEIFSHAYKDNINHVNQDNYKIKEDRLDGYIKFDVMYYQEDVVCFSGLWTHDDWRGCARAADRYYVFKKYRARGLLPNYKLPAASQFFIPSQFATSLDWGLSPFVSIQGSRKRADVFYLKDKLKEYANLDCVVLDDLRYTCIGQGSDHCWQNVITLESTESQVESVFQSRRPSISR